MHINRVRNQNGVESVLVRESYREGGKVKKRTVANLSRLPPAAQLAVAQVLAGKAVMAADEGIEILRSRQHGNAEAVLKAMRRLDLASLVSREGGRERDLVLALIAAPVLDPASKLATTQSWETTTLARTLNVEGATDDEVYRAMDWLLERQASIEERLAKRHLQACDLVLYDFTSTYVEGTHCPLAARGHSRDGKPEKLQVTFGMLTDEAGRPISVSVYGGNKGDASTVGDQIAKLKSEYGLDLVIFVGDRGMVAQTTIDHFICEGGVEWITALKSGGIRRLKADGALQLDLFDERGLFEVKSPWVPDERLIACRNPKLAERRRIKRQEMLAATRRELTKIQGMISRGRLRGRAEIGLRTGRVINKYKMAKHFKLTIEDGRLSFRTRSDSVQREAALDGIYVVRTSVPADVMSSDDVVRNYKRLTRIEKDFRNMKMVGLEVRPIFHWKESRVRAHIFLCMLAHYVQWHLQHAWRSLLFAEEVDSLPTRHPVKPAEPSAQVSQKKGSKKNAEGLRVQSFRSLLKHLGSVVANECAVRGKPDTFELITKRDAIQGRAMTLLDEL